MHKYNPALITKTNVQKLEVVPQKEYDEKYIQSLIFSNPHLLMLNEIDVSCGRIAPICREFCVDSAGHCIDDLFVDSNGVLTIVECKLIRNHQATREVVGQILDYAKEVVRYDYKELDRRIQKTAKKKLFDLASEWIEDLDCELFEENVSRNLKEGRINLVIAGDYISRNVEELVTFLNGYAKMSFKLGVVEIQLFKLPDTENRIAIPNCLFKTVEYKLYRIDTENRQEESEVKQENNLELFYEKLQKNTGVSKDLRMFVENVCNEYHLITTIGRGECISINLKTEDEQTNLMAVYDNGRVSFFGLTGNTQTESNDKIGRKYIQSICELVGAEPHYNKSCWSSHPLVNGERLNIKQLLKYTKSVGIYIGDYLSALEKIETEEKSI